MSYAIHNKDKVFQNIDYIKRQLDMLYEENMQFKATINSNINSYNKLSEYSNELENRIDKAIEYINIHLDIDNETGGYHLKHIFDSSNLYKLLKILDKENK